MRLRSEDIEFDIRVLKEIEGELEKESNRVSMIYELTREKMEEALRQEDITESAKTIEEYLDQDITSDELIKMLSVVTRMIKKSVIKTISFQNMIGGI